jgi:2-haloacid dehalogenase
MEYYANKIKSGRDPSLSWEPIDIMPRNWYNLKTHPDSKEGLDRLRKKYMIVTLSNGPIHILTYLSKKNDLTWDMMIPIQERKIYKPNLKAYKMCVDLMGVLSYSCMMVTSNENFGDLEASVAVGMHSCLVDRTKGETLIDLADKMGC